jgi:hypothetical protein
VKFLTDQFSVRQAAIRRDCELHRLRARGLSFLDLYGSPAPGGRLRETPR